MWFIFFGMNRPLAARTGVASIFTIPVFAVGPPATIALLHLPFRPDFFYLAVAGALISAALSLVAAIKGKWWWLLAPVGGVIITAFIYIFALVILGLFRK